MIQGEKRGDKVRIVSDSNGHLVPKDSVVTLKLRHGQHSDAWWCWEFPDVWIRTTDMEVLSTQNAGCC